jgi:pilus assembly protein CpaF
MDNATEYFAHRTQTANYDYKNIVEFKDGEYIFANQLTSRNVEEMRENMSHEDVKAFDEFLEVAWG